MGTLTREYTRARLRRAARKLLAGVDAEPAAHRQRWAALNALGALMKHMTPEDHDAAVQRLKDVAAEFAEGRVSA